MKINTKDEVLKYLGWYMNLIAVHIVLFGEFTSNYFILFNKINLLIYHNKLNETDIKEVHLKSKLSDLGINYKRFIGLEKLEIENMN